MFDLTTNYFELLGAKPSFCVDIHGLKTRYLELQRQVHPDNFASDSDRIQRESVQRVSYLNQAYETLKSPLQRAIYLLETAGYDFDVNTQIHDDVSFLVEQMAMREDLSEAGDAEDPHAVIEGLREKAESNYKLYQENFAVLYGKENWREASEEVNKMMFAFKLLNEISEKEESLFD